MESVPERAVFRLEFPRDRRPAEPPEQSRVHEYRNWSDVASIAEANGTHCTRILDVLRGPSQSRRMTAPGREQTILMGCNRPVADVQPMSATNR